MELSDCIKLFSTEVFTSVIDPLSMIRGKVGPYSDIVNSGVSAHRRILETPADEVVPPGRVVTDYSGSTYLIADGHPDYWKGEILRNKYPMLPAPLIGSAGDIGSTIAGTQPDKLLHSFLYFAHKDGEEDTRSDYLPGYNLFFSREKSFPSGSIVQLDSDHYRLTMDSYVDGAGYGVALMLKLENPLQAFTITTESGNYNPITDSYPVISTPNVICFVIPAEQDYEHTDAAFSKRLPGDKAISVNKADSTVQVNTKIGPYKVVSIRDDELFNTCLCRRA